MPTVTLYTRESCCLCDDAHEVLERVRAVAPFALDVVDVDTDPALAAQYGPEVPVITIDGRKAFKYRVDPRELRARLAHAEAGRYEPPAPDSDDEVG